MMTRRRRKAVTVGALLGVLAVMVTLVALGLVERARLGPGLFDGEPK